MAQMLQILRSRLLVSGKSSERQQEKTSRILMNIYPLLTKDHREIRKLLKKLGDRNETAVAARRDLFDTVKNELILHSEAEHHTLYRVLELYGGTRWMVAEDIARHRLIDDLLEELDCINAETDAWLAVLAVLKETVERHMIEEEQTLFPKARELLSNAQADAIGCCFQQQKQTALVAL